MRFYLIFFFSFLPLIFCRLLDEIFSLPKEVLFQGITFCLLFFLTVRKKQDIHFLKNPFFLPLLAIILTEVFSGVSAVNHFAWLVNIVQSFSFFLLVILLTEILGKEQLIKPVIYTITLTSVVVCFYGLLQLAGFDFFPWEVSSGSARSIISTLGRRNFTAEYLVAVFPFFLFLLLTEKSIPQKILQATGTFLLLLTVILSFTRASYLGLVAGFSVFLFFLLKKPFPGKKIALLLGIFILFRCYLCPAQIMTFDTTSLKSRLLIWKAALAMIKEKPFTGVGAGNFEFVSLPYAKKAGGLIPSGERVANAHNDYLEITAEQGILGLAAFLYLVIVLLRTGLKVIRGGNDQEKYLTVAVLSSWAGVLTNSLAAFPIENTAVKQILAFNLAVLFVFSSKLTKEREIHLSFKPALFKIIAGIMFFLFLFFAFCALGSSFCLKKSKRLFSLASQKQNLLYWALAERAGRLAVIFNPYSLEASFHLGTVYLSGNYPEYAKEQFLKALKLSPYSDTVADNLAISCHRLNQLEEAEKYYLYSLSLNPGRAETYNNLGCLYLEQGKREKATFYLEKALKLAPDFDLARKNLERAVKLKDE